MLRSLVGSEMCIRDSTGTYGRRIVGHLLRDKAVNVCAAGRSLRRLQQLGASLAAPDMATCVLDAGCAKSLRHALESEQPAVVISTAGPFQDESDFLVARSCIAHGVHYMDIADDSRFVTRFGKALDGEARERGVVALTGCSTVPSLTAAVMDAHVDEFDDFEAVHVAISPGDEFRV
eukprot:TRINITY_DN19079_c0_g1_i2.p3 TRINITY_DN19079_c0_g1~~TRINITY_DN19079_c0_g1_i2.p3  ORF type:complete len:177 (+),score=44.86 TRINITY_DN19079_c0_g1_i2:169-699(+)